MRVKKPLILMPALLFMASCVFGLEAHYIYDRGANFTLYRTYRWIEVSFGAPKIDPTPTAQKLEFPSPPPNLPAPLADLPGGAPNFPGTASFIRGSGSEDQLIDREIKRAVDEQLAQKGLTRVGKNADLEAIYHVAVHQERSLDLSGMGMGGRGLGGWWDGSVQGRTSTIPVGSLVVDLYDPARKQLIWRGDVNNTIRLKRDPDKNCKDLQKAIAKLFKNYPPTPIK